MKNKIILTVLIVLVVIGLVGVSIAIRHSLPEDSGFSGQETAWWSGRTATWIGVIGGCASGLLGSLVGLLGFLAGIGKRKCLDFAKMILMATLGIGVIYFVAGLVACATRQPYAVYYPLLLMGFLWGFLSPVLLRVFSTVGQMMELRKMESMDR